VGGVLWVPRAELLVLLVVMLVVVVWITRLRRGLNGGIVDPFNNREEQAIPMFMEAFPSRPWMLFIRLQ